MDKSRQQFESFIKKETGFDLHRTIYPMTKREDQQYSSHQTNLAWLSWQASRESLEVELPEPFIANEIWCYDEDLVNQELISNGVKIKNE